MTTGHAGPGTILAMTTASPSFLRQVVCLVARKRSSSRPGQAVRVFPASFERSGALPSSGFTPADGRARVLRFA